MNNPHENKVRTTVVVMEVTTYGSVEHREKSMARLKDEIELQGFHVKYLSETETT